MFWRSLEIALICMHLQRKSYTEGNGIQLRQSELFQTICGDLCEVYGDADTMWVLCTDPASPFKCR